MKVSAFVCGLFFLTVLVLFSAPGGEKAAPDELKILIRSTDGENPPELAAFLQEEQDIPLFTVGEKGVRVIGAWGVRLKTPRGRVETGPLLIFLWRDPALTGAIRSEEGFSPRDWTGPGGKLPSSLRSPFPALPWQAAAMPPMISSGGQLTGAWMHISSAHPSRSLP